VLVVAICSAGILATSSLASGGDLSGALGVRATIVAFGLAGLFVGTAGTVYMSLLNSRGVLRSWLKARGAAETVRADYVDAVVAADPPASQDGVTWTHLLKLEYFRRYQLDVQYAYFGRRGQDHEQAAQRSSVSVTWALGIVGLANGAAGLLGVWDLRWSAIAALAVVAQAVADRSKTMETLSQNRSNADVYEQLHRALGKMRSKYDDVRDLVITGKVEALTEYVNAVHELMASERARWSDTMSGAEAGMARLQQRLEQLKSGIGPQG
jgi:hypothetical protein